jgi:hypothetical protein
MIARRGPGASGVVGATSIERTGELEDVDDTVVELIHDLEEETLTGPSCSECGTPDPLAIVDVEPPPAYLLSGPTWWVKCVIAGTNRPAPTWWWCPKSQWYTVAGRFRIRIERKSRPYEPRPAILGRQ